MEVASWVFFPRFFEHNTFNNPSSHVIRIREGEEGEMSPTPKLDTVTTLSILKAFFVIFGRIDLE